MSVPQYTTPTFTLSFSEEDLDLTQAASVYVTFQSGSYVLTKDAEDLTVQEKSIDVYLTQNETARFQTGIVEIQVNWITPNGNRAASTVGTCQISKQLLKRVVT